MEVIQLELPMQPMAVFAHPKARKDQVAFIRGPFVYCAESVDNDAFSLEAAFVSPKAEIREKKATGSDVASIKDVPILVLDCDIQRGFGQVDEGYPTSLYTATPPEWDRGTRQLTLIPYFLRENRGGDGAMRVWFGRS